MATNQNPAVDPDINEALRQVVAHQIGPRRPGVIYENIDGAFRVLDVTTDPSEARRILKRRAAQFAITVIDVLRPDAEAFVVGSVWTGSDRVLKAVSA
ncbi:hypothetical protein [Streptomyces rubiginosohelvolus]|uniref:Uncharacterized protein n=1 Tax=Streptomyces rubiginosohelvolus TaxID=67362 RepID=A0ABQ3CBH3_9ACTN|nr:hypothetical protein [Streptomyces pluricolorescens]GGZ82749.1 hypothetical protein GCM10010328_66460 [Streptomyces pluricolorescens]